MTSVNLRMLQDFDTLLHNRNAHQVRAPRASARASCGCRLERAPSVPGSTWETCGAAHKRRAPSLGRGRKRDIGFICASVWNRANTTRGLAGMRLETPWQSLNTTSCISVMSSSSTSLQIKREHFKNALLPTETEHGSERCCYHGSATTDCLWGITCPLQTLYCDTDLPVANSLIYRNPRRVEPRPSCRMCESVAPSPLRRRGAGRRSWENSQQLRCALHSCPIKNAVSTLLTNTLRL